MSVPRPRRPRSSPESNLGTVLALSGLVFCGCGLLGLIVLVMPAAIGLVLIVVGFTIPIALQYLIWGWWLSRIRDEEQECETHEEEV